MDKFEEQKEKHSEYEDQVEVKEVKSHGEVLKPSNFWQKKNAKPERVAL